MPELIRLFIGGLPKEITDVEISQRLGKYGAVQDTEIKEKFDENGEWLKTFGYVNIEMDQQAFQKCKNQLNNTIWKGGKLSIQVAKQDTVVKLAEERSIKNKLDTLPAVNKGNQIVPKEIKGAVPGTLVPEHQDWVVTKFQRVVPIMNIRTKDKRKVMKIDPSKYSHQIKRLDNDKVLAKVSLEGMHYGAEMARDCESSVSELTWTLEAPDSVVDKHRVVYNLTFSSRSNKDGNTWKRSAQEIIAQEKSKKEESYNDLEIVDINSSSKKFKPGNPVSTLSKDINLDRFDSESDSEDESNDVISAKAAANKSSKRLEAVEDNISIANTDKIKDNASKKVSQPAAKGRLLFPGTSAFSDVPGSTIKSPDRLTRPSAPTNHLIEVPNSNKTVEASGCKKVSSSSHGLDKTQRNLSTSTKRTVGKGLKSSLLSNVVEDDDSDYTSSEDSDHSAEKTVAFKGRQSIETRLASSLVKKVEENEESDSTSSEDFGVSEKHIKIASKSKPNVENLLASSLITKVEEDDESDSTSSGNPDISEEKSTSILKGLKATILNDSKDQTSGNQQTALKPSNNKPEENNAASKKTKKEKKKFLTSTERHQLSDQKRLAAITEREMLLKNQKKVIQESLNKTDGLSNKKILFDSESEEDPSSKVASSCEKPTNGEQVLFSSSSSDEDEKEEEYEKMFAIKPQFEGEHGAKLLKLQQSYKDDSRFKLTEQFLESDSESEKSSAEKKSSAVKADPVVKNDELEDERLRNLKILQSIVGSNKVKLDHPSHSKAKKAADTPAGVFRSISGLHFDPTDKKAEQLIKPVEKSDKPKKKKKKVEGSEPIVGAEPPPVVTKDKFYEVAIDFTKAESSGGALFGFFDESSDATKEKDTAISENSKNNNSQLAGTTSMNFLQNFGDIGVDEDSSEQSDLDSGEDEVSDEDADDDADDDDADDADDDIVDDDNRRSVTTSGTDTQEASTTASHIKRKQDSKGETLQDKTNGDTVVDWFFFKPDDPRIIDGSSRFSRSMDVKTLKANWLTIRPKLVEDYLMKSKRATKKFASKRKSGVQKKFASKPKRNV